MNSASENSRLCRFGEGLDPDVLGEAAEALQTCDLFMTIGTSSVVYPAAGFAAQVNLLLTFVDCPPIQTAQDSVCKDNTTTYCRLQPITPMQHTLNPCAGCQTTAHTHLIQSTSVYTYRLVNRLWCIWCSDENIGRYIAHCTIHL